MKRYVGLALAFTMVGACGAATRSGVEGEGASGDDGTASAGASGADGAEGLDAAARDDVDHGSAVPPGAQMDAGAADSNNTGSAPDDSFLPPFGTRCPPYPPDYPPAQLFAELDGVHKLYRREEGQPASCNTEAGNYRLVVSGTEGRVTLEWPSGDVWSGQWNGQDGDQLCLAEGFGFTVTLRDPAGNGVDMIVTAIGTRPLILNLAFVEAGQPEPMPCWLALGER